MAPDQIYQPIVSDDDDQSETPSPRTELQIEDPAAFREKKPDDEDLTAEEATAERSRRPDPESAESAYERPLVVHKVRGVGPISVNEATDAMRWSRASKLGAELREAGYTERQVGEMAADAIARGERLDPLAPPPPEVKILEHFGEDKKVLTPTEAANELTSWRERYIAEQQAEFAELANEAEQERAQLAQQAQQPTEQPQRQQPQPEMTPAQTERAQLAAERQWITNLKRIEGHEAALRNDLDQVAQAAVARFPSLQHARPSPEQVEDLRQKDPARYAELMQFDQMIRERQQRIASIAQQRSVHEQQQAQINAQARAAARSQQDAAFEQLAAQHIPNWERVHGEVRQQARKTLENAGLSQDEIQHLWTGDHSIDAHSSVLQLILAKAALYDRAQERYHQVRQSNLPQVMKPGMYRRASDDDAQSVNELRARLKKASGREALRLGAALMKAQRVNGG